MAENDTTRKAGVSDEQQEPIATRPMRDNDNPRRGPVLQEIYDRNREKRAAEIAESEAIVAGEQPPSDPDNSQALAAEPATDEDQGRSAAPSDGSAGPDQPVGGAEPGGSEPSPPAESAAPTPAVEMATITRVDGTEEQVPLSTLRLPVTIDGHKTTISGEQASQGPQMIAAGQARLREGTARLREAKDAEHQLRTMTPAATDLETTGPGPEPTTSSEDEEALAIAKKLQYGDDTEAAEAIKQLRKSPASSGVDDDTLIDRALARQKTINDGQEAHRQAAAKYMADLNKFAEDFPEVVADDGLRQMSANYVHTVRAYDLSQIGYPGVERMTQDQLRTHHGAEQAKGMVRSTPEVLAMAGQATRIWLKDRVTAAQNGGARPTTDPNGLDGKKDAKREGGQAPKGASIRSAGQPAPQTRTASQTIAQMGQDRKGHTNPHYRPRT